MHGFRQKLHADKLPYKLDLESCNVLFSLHSTCRVLTMQAPVGGPGRECASTGTSHAYFNYRDSCHEQTWMYLLLTTHTFRKRAEVFDAFSLKRIGLVQRR